jgi:hypothetical protein
MPKDFDLVCHGKVLAPPEKQGPTNNSYVFVYIRVVDPAAKPAYQVSDAPTRTVAEAKAELSRTLGRPVAQLSIIDH